MNNIFIVQLPFPSTSNAHPDLVNYYKTYGYKLSSVLSDFYIPSDDLWEMPLWVAHLAGQLEALGYRPAFLDLSRAAQCAEACAAAILNEVPVGGTVLLSPLAQNFDLARAVSKTLLAEGRRSILGGNMATLAEAGDASFIYRGIADAGLLNSVLHD